MGPRLKAWAVVPLAVLALQMLVPASGHGLMIQPKARNWVAYLKDNYYWAHGLNAGGAIMISNKQQLKYPNGRRGYCGDAYNETKWDVPGTIQNTYRSGQTINIDVVVTTNHMGRFSVQICPLEAKRGEGKCKNLYLRVAGHKGIKSWYLPGIKGWTGGNWGGNGPKYGDGTFQAYQLPEIGDWMGYGCSGQRLCNAYKGMWVYRTQWMLPKDFVCDHCKLQWTWTTGHNCWPSCEPDNTMAQCQNKQAYPTCGSNGAAYPEEFINCADVKVIDNGKIDSKTNYPPWNDAVKGAILKGTWGKVQPSIMNEKE